MFPKLRSYTQCYSVALTNKETEKGKEYQKVWMSLEVAGRIYKDLQGSPTENA